VDCLSWAHWIWQKFVGSTYGRAHRTYQGDGEAFWKTLELPKGFIHRCFLFQFPEHQFFAETVYDEVAFAAKNFELDSIEERVKKSLDIAGLSFDEFKDRSPFTLSGGEKRKVALASVIVCDPSAGLDGASKKALYYPFVGRSCGC